MSFENPADSNTFWCCYIGCFGYGIGKVPACKPGDVLCLGQGKVCCLKQEGKGVCGECGGSEGFCFGRSQYCCLENGCQIVPTKPFVEFCGKRVYGPGKSGGSVQDAGGRFGYRGDDAVTCGIQEELEEAVRRQDYLRTYKAILNAIVFEYRLWILILACIGAHELKLRLHALRDSKGLPESVSMS